MAFKLFSAISSFASGRANERILEDEAVFQRQVGAIKEGKFRRNAKKFRASQQARLSAVWQGPDTEIARNIEADTVTQQELDALTIRFGAEMAARNLKAKAMRTRQTTNLNLFGDVLETGESLLTQGTGF